MTNSNAMERVNALYAAFNRRDSSFVIDQMTDDVKWPRAFKGGYVHGQDAVRAYWEEQWQEIDPRVDPVAIEWLDDGRLRVEVHQVVNDLEGNLIDDATVHHIYTFIDDEIAVMDLD